MRLQSVWERLHEVKGMHFEELIEWLKINDEDFDDDYDFEEGRLYVGGFYADFAPVFKFEDGVVVRWWRDDCWD